MYRHAALLALIALCAVPHSSAANAPMKIDTKVLDYELFQLEAAVRRDAGRDALQSTQPQAQDWCTGEREVVDKVICLRQTLADERARRLANVAKHRALPSIPPVYGIITSPFGPRRSPIGGKRELHAGLDIAAPRGSLFVAPADGVVIAVERQPGYGAMIVVAHGNGVETRYAHVGAALVKPHVRVRRGQPLGMIGLTGKTTGPHLHYEVWIDGRAVDPAPFVMLPTLAEIRASAG